MKLHLSLIQIIFIILTLTIISCKEEKIQVEEEEEIIIETPEPPAPVFYLALGDSYTIGQGVEEAESYPFQLSDQLRQNGYQVNETNVIAQTGWTTNYLLGAVDYFNPQNQNLVSLLIGVNNQYQSYPFEIFPVEFDSLLNKSIALAGSKERVFVLSIPDYGVTPLGSSNSEEIGQEIDMYNDYIRQRCLEENIPYVDVTGISREFGDGPDALSDGLHPSATQYAAWVEEALPVVLEILTE